MKHILVAQSFLVLISLMLVTRSTLAQTATPIPTATPGGETQPLVEGLEGYPSLAEIYGDPVLTINDASGDLAQCQDTSVIIGEGPSDITHLEVYRVPDHLTLVDGWLVVGYTATPYQQIVDGSFSAAAALQGTTNEGQPDNRLYEIHDSILRIGAATADFTLIDGTRDLAELSPDGTAVVFNISLGVDEFQWVTFHSQLEGDSAVCDRVPDTGVVALSAGLWMPTNASLVATIEDPFSDTVICGVGGSAVAPQADISSVDIYRASDKAYYPGGWYVVMFSDEIVGEAANNTARYTAMLNLFRGDESNENWLFDTAGGGQSSYVLDPSFSPIENNINFAGPAADRNAIVVHVPADTKRFQASTSWTAGGSDQSICDVAPDDGYFNLPADESVQLAASPTPFVPIVCDSAQEHVPEILLEAALSEAPGSDGSRAVLDLQRPDLDYHSLYNPLRWVEQCR